ncbi:hypothetical protein [Actinoplanes sp. NPDC049681]|uniref:AMIN-like domain-containing (lipo)protein n=1 Tax=Actinoplanes sp. NPDC049681 TaxID=3363905 RepID=UPI0037BB84A6
MKRMFGRMLAALAGAAVLLGGCAGNSGSTPQSTGSASAPRPVITRSLTRTPTPDRSGAPAASPQSSWTSGPVAVRHDPPVPPVPVVSSIRYAAHSQEGFDRIVLDIQGALPGYSVRYVPEVRADPSDQPIRMPGRRYLLMVLTPAQAHRDDGTATVSTVHPTGLPVLKGYAVAGDFEGHVSVALGLDVVVGYRVGELPGRIYLDVAA